MRRPDRTLATADHNVPTDGTPVAARIRDQLSRIQVETLERNAAEFGIPLYSLGSDRQGIVHVIGPELGRHPAGHDDRLRRLAHRHPRRLRRARLRDRHERGRARARHAVPDPVASPSSMRIRYEGELGFGVTAKDLILGTIGQMGVDGAVGHVVEYAGPAIEALSMEGRMTVCNMTIEGGGRAGHGRARRHDLRLGRGPRRQAAPERPRRGRRGLARRCAPRTARRFDRRSSSTPARCRPLVTWGTTPGHGRAGHRRACPSPHSEGAERALKYMASSRARRSQRHPRRPRVHRLVHELAHRRPARRRRGGATAARSRPTCARWSSRARCR